MRATIAFVMLDDASRAMWAELDAIDRRRWPRFESRFGVCPSCGKGATRVSALSSICWSVCESCLVRWYAGEGFLEGEAALEDMALLADCETLS
jgi:hypothetical protein